MLAKVSISNNKNSFLPGEVINISINFYHKPEDARTNTPINLNIGISRIDVERNSFVVGTGMPLTLDGQQLRATIKIPEGATQGIHFFSELAVLEIENGEPGNRLPLVFESPIFEVRHLLALAKPINDLQARLADLERKRSAYLSRVHITTAAKERGHSTRNFRVIIFATGCNIHTEQHMDGYKISPIRLGLSHQRLLDVTNQYLETQGIEAIAHLEETERQFSNSTPTMAVDFHQIESIDHQDAIVYAQSLSSDIFQILGLEQGQIPRQFALLATEYDTTNRWHRFEIPWYRGNQIRGFEPSQIARTIDTYLPRLQGNPFQRLLLRSFAEATDDDDWGFQVLRYWTVLELAANRKVPGNIGIYHPNGDPILRPDGQPATTKHKGNMVYEYVRRMDSFLSHEHQEIDGQSVLAEIWKLSTSSETEYRSCYSLRDIVEACYAVRNAVAHEGIYDPDAQGTTSNPMAARIVKRGSPNLLSFLKMQAKLAIWHESQP